MAAARVVVVAAAAAACGGGGNGDGSWRRWRWRRRGLCNGSMLVCECVRACVSAWAGGRTGGPLTCGIAMQRAHVPPHDLPARVASIEDAGGHADLVREGGGASECPFSFAGSAQGAPSSEDGAPRRTRLRLRRPAYRQPARKKLTQRDGGENPRATPFSVAHHDGAGPVMAG